MAPRVLREVVMSARCSSLLAALFFASACSGAAPTELFDPLSEESSPVLPIGGGEANGPGAPAGGTDGASSSGAPAAPPSRDGGANADAGAPAPPSDECVVEKEPNDGPEETAWFTKCFTGSLAKGDRDYASISAPLTAKRVEIEHEEDGGDVRYRLYVNGVLFDTFEDDPPKFVPVFGGGTYSFEMTPEGGSKKRTYRLRVRFE